MLATKNRPAGKVAFLLASAVLIAGCMPPGPRALLDGKKLLDRGNYAEAVEKLKLATTLLGTNAQAWSYLGLAYHHADQWTNAVAAYHRALALNQNLSEVHFNLGCLWLEQNRFDAAKEEFTTYTMLRRGQSVEGFLKLGTAQYRARETAPAEESFRKALRLSPRCPEALNGLGLVQLQRNRPREAAQRFEEALKQQPNYRPALLNLATVSHRYLNDPAGALKKYQEYLALEPRATDWEAVNAVVKTLEQQSAPPPPRPAATVAAAPPPAVVSSAPKPAARPAAPPKVEPAPSPPKISPTPSPPATVVKLPPEPVIKTSPESSPAPSGTAAPVTAPPVITSSPPVVASAPPPPKRSFWQRLNPFHREPKPPPKPVPLPAPAPVEAKKPVAATTLSAEPAPAQPPPAPTTPVVETAPIRTSPPEAATSTSSSTRYNYLSPPAPVAGDRVAAERAFAQGTQAQRANRLPEAAAAYQQAGRVDPTYFDAFYNLGLVAYEMRNYRLSLSAWESVLAIRPDSTDARYNFALALKAAKYPLDAANELEKILAAAPDEARAHLVLANIYAEQLHDTAKARMHFKRVLELDPRHPQATAIRYWLVANPP